MAEEPKARLSRRRASRVIEDSPERNPWGPQLTNDGVLRLNIDSLLKKWP